MSEKHLIQFKLGFQKEVKILRELTKVLKVHRLRNNNLWCSLTAENNLRSKRVSALKIATLKNIKNILMFESIGVGNGQSR